MTKSNPLQEIESRLAEIEKRAEEAKEFEREYQDDSPPDAYETGYFPPRPSPEEIENYEGALAEMRFYFPSLAAGLRVAVATIKEWRDDFADCVCDEPERCHESIMCQAHFDLDAALAQIAERLAGVRG